MQLPDFQSLRRICTSLWRRNMDADETLKKRTNGCCTRLLRKARGWSYNDHKTPVKIYGDIPQVTSVIRGGGMWV